MVSEVRSCKDQGANEAFRPFIDGRNSFRKFEGVDPRLRLRLQESETRTRYTGKYILYIEALKHAESMTRLGSQPTMLIKLILCKLGSKDTVNHIRT